MKEFYAAIAKPGSCEHLICGPAFAAPRQSSQDPKEYEPSSLSPSRRRVPDQRIRMLKGAEACPTDKPIEQQDSVTPKNSKEDVDAIGNRSVAQGVNFYSLEKEIALGKQLRREVERSSKLSDDPVVTGT